MIARYEHISPCEPLIHNGEEVWKPHSRKLVGKEVIKLDIWRQKCPICGKQEPKWRINGRRPILSFQDENLPLVVEVELFTSPRGAFWWKMHPLAESLGLLHRHYYFRDNGSVLFYFSDPENSPTAVWLPRYDQELIPSDPRPLVWWENNMSGFVWGSPASFPELPVKEVPHIGCVVESYIRGKDPAYQQGNLSLFLLSNSEHLIDLLPNVTEIFNHRIDPPETVWITKPFLIRKIGESRYGLGILRIGEDQKIISSDHAPLQPSPGVYLGLHPIPEYGQD